MGKAGRKAVRKARVASATACQISHKNKSARRKPYIELSRAIYCYN